MAALLTTLSSVTAFAAADHLDWRQREDSVDAQIEGWPLTKLLERISAKTRWQIFVEPDLEYSVSAKFKDLKTGEALRHLLGRLNFMLVPVTNAPPKLFIFRTAMKAATELVAAPAERETTAEGKVIGNELVVSLKQGAKESIDDLAKRLGAKVVGRQDNLRTYRLRFDDDAAAQNARGSLADDTDVSSVQNNYAVPRPDRPEAVPVDGWPGLNLIPKASTDSSRVVVGLVDTGVQTQAPMLKDFLLKGISVADPATPPTDQPTHGTAMAETMLADLARAPGNSSGTLVRILPVDVYGASDTTTTFDIAKGIYTAINAGATIINLSLGSEADSPMLHDVIKAGHDQGVVFVAAAGNEPVTTPTYPAAYPEVVAVTAGTRSGQVASYANRGDFVSVMAPGTSLVPFDNQTFVVVGTSTAAANASALTAALAAAGGKTGAALEAQLRQAFPPPPKMTGP